MVTRRIRFELWLATTAIILVTAGLSLPVQSAPLTEEEISAAVPMPESANLPPPTISDIAPVRRPADEPAAATPAPVAPPAAAGDTTQPTTTPAAATPETTTPAAAAPAAATPEAVTPAVAAPPAVAPAEAPVLTMDQRVAEKIRDLFGNKADRILDRKAKAPVEAFYSARNYAPIWIEDGAESARAKAAAAYLAGVGADGLDPSD